MMHVPAIRFFGEGGKGGKTPRESPDSIFTNQVANVLDLLSEGEIEGIVGGNKGIYYNEVALEAADGTNNFSGVSIAVNTGTPDQGAFDGFSDVRSTIAVQQELPANVNKTISFVNDGSVTQVLVTVSGANFFMVEKDGDTVAASVNFVIEVSENSGAFVERGAYTIRGKQNDEFTLDYAVPIVAPSGNTAVRVRRTTADSSSLKVNNSISFKSYTKVVEHKLSYPNCALAGHTIDAKQFGNKVPTRQYRARGIKCRIPHNYDPVTRLYTGAFNGTFKTAKFYTNNPAWVYLELVTNRRFGLGQYMNPAYVDIPSLYTLAKWLDASNERPAGTTENYAATGKHGVPNGAGGFEPRWTCNAYLTQRGEAFNILKELVSGFRGNLFWMQAKLWAFADAPKQPTKIVTNANIIGGKFTYTGESNRQRRSVINVTFSDPDLNFRRGIETVEDPNLILELGYRDADFGAFGCSSRSQAHRMGQAVLFTQEFESSMVSYKASFDHMAVDGDGPDGIAPGDMVLVADKEKGNARSGGRVFAGSTPAVYGPERIVNGGFDTTGTWVTGVGVTISGGKANYLNVGATEDSLYQGALPAAGTLINVTFTISDYVSGGVRLHSGNPSFGPIFTANGTYTVETTVPAGGNVNLIFKATAAGTTLSIDNVSTRLVTTPASTNITLDRNAGTGTGQLYVEHANGDIEWLTCTWTTPDALEETKTAVTLTQVPVQPVAANDLFILVDSGFVAVPYIVLKIRRSSKIECEVTAVRWDENRWAKIYGAPSLDPVRYMELAARHTEHTTPANGPITYNDRYVYNIDRYYRSIVVAWRPSPDELVAGYVVRYRFTNGESVELPMVTQPQVTILDTKAGVYDVQIFAVNRAGNYSIPISTTITLPVTPDTSSLPMGTITNLRLVGQVNNLGSEFTGSSVTLEWDMNTPTGLYLQEAGVGITTGVDTGFRDCLVTIKNTATAAILRQVSIVGNRYTYSRDDNFDDTRGAPTDAMTVEVQYRDMYGRTGPVVAKAVTNPDPAAITAPTVSNGALSNTLRWTNPVINDLSHVEVLASTTNLIGSASVVGTTLNGTFTHENLVAGNVWYYWLKAVDSWGNGSVIVFVGSVTVQSISAVEGIGADGILHPSEKLDIIREFNQLTNEKAGIDAQADSLAVARVPYDNAYDALNTYLTGLNPAYNNTAVSTTVVRATWNTNWQNLYTQRQALLNALDAKAATIANWAGIVTRPANLAELTGTEGIRNSMITIGANGALLNAGGGQVLIESIAPGLRADADAAVLFTNDVADDNKFSRAEKKRYVVHVNGWIASVPAQVTQLNALGLTTEANNLTAAWSGATGFLPYLQGLNYTILTSSATITRAEFNAKSKAFTDALVAGANALDAKAATTANWSLLAGTVPTNVANNQITIGANGALLNAGGGQVFVPSQTFTPLGTGANYTLIGNKITRTAGGTDYTAVVRGEPHRGNLVSEVDLTVGWNMIAFGTTATNSLWNDQELTVHYNSSGALNVYSSGNSLVTSTVVASSIGKLRLAYDGVRFAVFVNGAEVWTGSSYYPVALGLTAVPANLILYPKWWAYEASKVVTGMEYGSFAIQPRVGSTIQLPDGNVASDADLLNSQIALESYDSGGTARFRFRRGASTYYSDISSNIAFGATVGGTWGTNIGSRPTNLAGLAGTEGIRNDAISIGSNGALAGANGGQVSITGLGYSGALNATFGAKIGNFYADDGVTVLGNDDIRNSTLAIDTAVNAQGRRHVRLRRGATTYMSDIDLNVQDGSTLGAAWGSNLSGRPANVAALGGGEGINNGAITIGANGAILNAGGGQVSITGLGFLGDLNADKAVDLFIINAGTATIKGNNVTSTSGAWSGNVYTREQYRGGAIAQGTIVGGGMIGLSYNYSSRAVNSYADIQFAIQGYANNYAIYENGNFIQSGAWDNGQRFTVRYNNNKIEYFVGVTLARELVVGANQPFHGAIALGGVNDRIDNFHFDAHGDTTWGGLSGTRPANLAALAGSEGVRNDAISIGSNGALAGANGGQVTPNGLGLAFGDNYLIDSDFANGLSAFRVGIPTTDNGATQPTTQYGLNLDATYSGIRQVYYATVNTANWTAGRSLDALQTKGPYGGGSVEEMRRYSMPVKNGDRVYYRSLMAVHRCTASLFLLVFDKNGTLIHAPSVSGGRIFGGGLGGNPTEFDVVGETTLIAGFPSAAYACLMWRMYSAGQNDPYLFMTEPAMGIIPAGQTLLPPYRAGRSDVSPTMDYARGRVTDPQIYNTQMVIGAESTTNLSPSYTNNGSNVTVNLPAHVRKIAGLNGPVTLSYAAQSAVLPYSTYWTAYVVDTNQTGGSMAAAFTSNPDELLYPGRYQISSGRTIDAGGGGGTTTGGGGGGTIGDCVAAESFMPSGQIAMRVEKGDGIVVLSEDCQTTTVAVVEGNFMANAECVEIESESGIRLILSANTPCTLATGICVAAKDIEGYELAVMDDDGFRWENIVRATAIGQRAVSHISCGEGTYAAGAEVGRYIFTHNVVNKP